MICQLCEGVQSFLVCATCKNEILKNRWQGCARCGRPGCQGCDKLSSFSRVCSLYTLQNIFSNWVSRAKDVGDDWYIQIFEDVFMYSFLEILYQTVSKIDVDYILLSPFRLNRLVDKPWHPILCLFDKIAKDERFKNHLAGVLIGTHREKFKMAHLKTGQRFDEKFSQGFPSLIWDGIYFKQRAAVQRILVVDDILTSGTTAIRCQNSILPFLATEKTDWMLQTLFRTPQTKQL